MAQQKDHVELEEERREIRTHAQAEYSSRGW